MSGITRKWKPEGYDYGKAQKLYWQPRDPAGDTEKHDVLGFQSQADNYIWVDSDADEFTEGVTSRATPGKKVTSSRAGTLAHEISHWKLDHRGLTHRAIGDAEHREEFWAPLDYIEPRINPITGESWETLRDEVHELEARLHQELQDYHQDRGDSFLNYFEDLLNEQILGNPNKAYLVREIAYQALKNMEKRELLPKRKKLKYWRAIDQLYDKITSRSYSFIAKNPKGHLQPEETQQWQMADWQRLAKKTGKEYGREPLTGDDFVIKPGMQFLERKGTSKYPKEPPKGKPF